MTEQSSKALTALLNQHSVVVESGYSSFKVELIGLERLVFVGAVDRSNPMYPDGKDELCYTVETIPKRNKVRLSISKVNQSNPHEPEVLAKDAGDLWGSSMRKRLVKQVYKRDWQVSNVVEKDLEKLASQVAYYRANRERMLLESIRKGDNRELQERLLTIEQAQPPSFPAQTQELLAALEKRPVEIIDGEPTAIFTRQDVAGQMGISIDAVRNRLSPLEGQPFFRIKQRGKGNQPTIYCYLPNKRATGAKVQRQASITSDTEIVAPPKVATSTRRESKELLRYGETPKEGSY